jgi:ankyrin repeat protein
MKFTKGLLLTISLIFAISTVVKANSPHKTIEENIFAAIKNIDYVSINVLLSDGTDVDTVDQEGNTPLMVAAKVGNLRILDIIFSHNPEVNAQNNNGSTALMIAAQTGQLQVVKKLVENGAEAALRDNNDNTALTLASKFGHDKIVSYLKTLRTQGTLAK